MPLLLFLLSVPCVYWTQGIESRVTLEAAGITRFCNDAELASREALPTPGITARPGLASPTRSPWIVANGWRFTRHPEKKYVYDVPAGKAALAAAEASAYGVDAVLKIDPADVRNLGAMLTFLEALPAADLPVVADLAVVDDGSAVTGEVMNLLARRNLLFQVVQTPSARFRINIAMGGAGYAIEEATDPNGFALKIRRQLTDEQRSLRIYGSEVVICRLTGDAGRIRAHLINYGGREIEGLRIRLRGAYRSGVAHIAGAGRLPLQDQMIAGGFAGSDDYSVDGHRRAGAGCRPSEHCLHHVRRPRCARDWHSLASPRPGGYSLRDACMEAPIKVTDNDTGRRSVEIDCIMVV